MMYASNVSCGARIIILLFGTLSIASRCYGDDIQKDPYKICKHIPKKAINKAFLTIDTERFFRERNVTVTVNTISTECYTCNLTSTAVIEPQRNSCTILVDTRWKMKVSIDGDNLTKAANNCSMEHLSTWFEEGGNYSIFVSYHADQIYCGRPFLNNSPSDSNTPLYVALGSLVGLTGLVILLQYCYRNHMLRRLQHCCRDADAFVDPNEYSQQDLGLPTNLTEEDVNRPPAKERLKSLDTFRGISIVLMIFVNYGGGDYWFFKHSKWNGLTVADLVFPWFIWIMGTAMAFSMKSQLRRPIPRKMMFIKIFKRSCILFMLGLLINSSDGLNPVKMKKFRIPGVLQRFAGTYLITATLHLFCAKPNDPNAHSYWQSIRDLTDYAWEWFFNVIFVVVWLIMTFGFSLPNGCGRGYIGPGGLANDGDSKQNVSLCTGGMASYIDRQVFGADRIYQHPSCLEIYQTTIPHDPEGLLGIFTSCFLCFLGLQAGKILLTFQDWKARTKRFVIWGVVLGIVTVILCEGRKNGGFIPINKNLWSLSFVLCNGCFAFFLFAFCYFTIDVYKFWSGAPFYYPGMNAIVLYMGHEILNQPWRTFWGIQPRSHMVYLPINILDTAVWIFLSYFMYRKKIFISI